MEKKYEDLLPFVNKYKEEVAAVPIRRELWQSKIRNLIEQTFKDFIEENNLPCYLAIDDNILNQESIYLLFNDQPTGIVVKANNRMLFQSGGGLVYHQNANGKIEVTIVLPFIENLKGEKGAHVEIEIVKPEDIDEPLIFSHLIRFFKETLEWECFLRQPIGYNH